MIINQQIFEAFVKCPTKSQLSRDASVVDENSVGRPQELEQIFICNGWSRLCASIPADQVIIGASATEAIRERRGGLIVVDCAIETSDLGARLHGLEVIGAPANAQTRYIPIRFLSNEKVSATDKLLLAFDAFVLSQVSGCRPDRGKLIHGREYTTTVVSLAPLYGRIKSVMKAITALQANASPPPVVLNRHCSECQYASRCRQVAEKADDLSLLAKMTEKTRQKYHQKGIFTVTQLSYTYRPRRGRGGVKHDHALKALAIRKNQVHVIGKVAFSQVGTPIYIDVEGDPDRGLYYCIGLRFQAGGLMTQRSYWADTPADEAKMWADCPLALSTIECPRLIHYGSYETIFLRQMKKRYPNRGNPIAQPPRNTHERGARRRGRQTDFEIRVRGTARVRFGAARGTCLALRLRVGSGELAEGTRHFRIPGEPGEAGRPPPVCGLHRVPFTRFRLGLRAAVCQRGDHQLG
jgi:predicted RecB family nuclease